MSWNRVALLALAGVSSSAHAALLFYGGNADYINGNTLPHSAPEQHQSARVYDDFRLIERSQINSLFADHQMTDGYVPTHAEFEIRTGMSAGSAGTLVAANGFVVCESTPTGRVHPISQVPEFRIRVQGLQLNLDPGAYWIMIRPFVPSLEAYLRETNGENAVGSPIGNGNSFWVYGFAGANYSLIPNSFDAPYGVEGTIVPEPGTFALLGIGFITWRSRGRKALD